MIACLECGESKWLITSNFTVGVRVYDGVVQRGPLPHGPSGSPAILECENEECGAIVEISDLIERANLSDDEVGALWAHFGDDFNQGAW